MAIDYTETRQLALAYFMSGMTNEQFCEFTGMSMQSFKDRKHGCKEIFAQAQREVIALKGKKAISQSDAQTEQQPKSDSKSAEDKITVEWPNGTKMDFYSLEDFEKTLGIFPVFFMRYCGYREFNVMRDHQVVAAFQHAKGDHSILPLVHLRNTPWWKMPLEYRFRIFDEDGCRLVGRRLISHLVRSGREHEMDEAVEHLKLWNKIQEWRLRLPGPYSTKLPGEKWPKPVYELRPSDEEDDPRRQSFDV